MAQIETFKHGRGGYARKCRCDVCREAALAYNREWNANHPEKRAAYVRAHRIHKAYGITEQTYQAMVAERHNRCDICGQEPGPEAHRLHIDHDHATGRVRGLLCNQCNRAMGLMGDDPDRLVSAAQYLHVEWN